MRISTAVFLILFTTFFVKAADTKDIDGYPFLYLRGSETGWTPKEEYKFSRSGNEYSITLKELKGEFKIGGDSWEYDYGGGIKGSEAKKIISKSVIVNAVIAGSNFIADNLVDVTITLAIDKDKPSAPVKIAFQVAGKVPQWNVSGMLPVLYINVKFEDGSFNDEIIDFNLSHKNYFTGEYWLDAGACGENKEKGIISVGSESSPLPLEIKARGNYTRTAFSKKPFKLKLGKKENLLGLSKSKHFALLAHSDDTWGFMRNFAGFNLGNRIGLPWTPSQYPVELIINGDYRGLYFLTESIRVDKERVNIEELEDNAVSPELISGGYIVELDNYNEDNQIRMEELSCVPNHHLDLLRITWDTPENYSEIQQRFVREQFESINQSVGKNEDKIWSYLDLDDAVRYYLVEEILSHTESFHGSTYLFRDRGEGNKWHFSPLWDFGNAFSGPTDGFFYDHDPYGNTWIPSLRENGKFNEKLKETWLWFMSNNFEGFFDDMRSYADLISVPARYDHDRWKDERTPVNGVKVADNSNMVEKLNKVESHIRSKIEWLKNVFGDYSKVTITNEPERDLTPAAPLPDYAVANLPLILTKYKDTEYYNLQGIRVMFPVRGQIYIVKSGEKIEKRVYR